jgi:diguanylate cyclase (GGDEF)-like protein/putative nucleotidyltransferase with HDIG domain
VNAQIQLVHMGLAVTTAVTAGFFAHIYREKQGLYLRPWALACCLVALRSAGLVVAPAIGQSAWLLALDGWLIEAAGLAFLWSAWEYVEESPKLPLLGSMAAGFALWSVAYRFHQIPVPPNFGAAVIFLYIAWVFYLGGRRRHETADWLMAFAFLVWAPLPVLGVYFGPLGTRARYNLTVLTTIPELFVAVMMLIVTYDKEKRRVESSLLALSNLNLATSGLLGGEISMMLSQVLESVLSAVRMPAGAFLLHHGDSRGPTSFVSVGLEESFCRAVQEEGLDDYLAQLPSQVDDAVVFRDLQRDGVDAALPQDERFRRFQRLATDSEFRTVLVAALKTKDKNFGALLLAAPKGKRLAPAELFLSKELSHQIAMAIENRYLVQQTWRRSEELRALHEIGRALSSMLDPDALLEKIFTEVQRLFNPSNFYVALYDSARNELRLELEVADGVRLPKRSRPMGSHLAEYILRTSRPLLIRENFEETIRRLGVQSQGQPGAFCGVPLIVYERTIGVMAVRSAQERTFDDEHLDILRVLASEASIAIENARLFHQEQTKSRHLALLNNISRSAISTVHPEEMLVDIAELLNQGLSFDHIGIAILDYGSKEVVVQAEAGRRRGALNRRLELSASFVGRVARTGRMSLVQDFAEESDGRPVLEGSASGVALPILYADQLLGVLYVETDGPASFSDEDLLLLHTLADLIAGALHNALAFQKAQEQAITDGLTGVKTHRFFMDALSAEWKRATRAGRPFTVALIDVDRFKFINDFQGHLEGDLVLKRLGETFGQACRSSDVVARYGGDEFVILMPETDAEQGLHLAQKLRSCILADRLLQAKNTTASIGLATFPLHGSTPQELIQIADAAMYLSKHQGGNAVSLSDNLDGGKTKQWKRDVLETYLGVTLKRLSSTGPEAFQDIRRRLEQLWQSLATTEPSTIDSGEQTGGPAESVRAPSVVVIEAISTLALAVDAKDPHTQGHSQKVADYSALLAEELGLREEEVEAVRLGALLHDVGKVGIPAAILGKNGPLDADEWETMKEHARLGGRLLEPLASVAHIRRMVCHHHEMFDGSGYPDRLAGEDIPLGARIIAIADAYDTITSDRTYKKARTPEEAVAELTRCAGTQFDPGLVRLFVHLWERCLNASPVLAQLSAK